MNKALLFLLLLIYSFLFVKADAQCELHPVIKPDNLILCPNASDTLYVTKQFDTYQWFRFNKAIPGATQQFLVVNAAEDAGALFKVKVTKGACADTSKKVLVDGYAFTSPVIITNGDASYFDANTGTSVFCKNSPVSLTFPEPYTVNVQWYNNGKPIVGADSSTYVVKSNGSYTVCGAPEVCPLFTQCEGVPVNIAIDKSAPIVRQVGDSLISTKGQIYQWMLNGNPIPGANAIYYVPSRKGLYSVAVTDKVNCTVTSQPILFTAKKNIVITPNPAHDFIIVKLNNDEVAQVIISDIYGNRRVQLSATSDKQKIAVDQLITGTYIVHILDKKGFEIADAKFMKN